MSARKSPVKTQKAWPANYMVMAIGRSNFYMMAFINTVEHRIGVILAIGGPDSKAHYELILREKDEIEDELNYELEWFENPGKKEKHIRRQRTNANPAEKENWENYREFLASTLEDFNRVFRTRIKGLKAAEFLLSE